MAAKLELGRVVAERYRVVERARRDSFGEVFIARDVRDDRQVSLRVLDSDICVAPGSSTAVLSLAKRLEHSRVASIVDLVLDEEERWVLVTELAAGQTLAERIAAKGPLSSSEAFALAADLADGLRAIHLAGGVHGRLDPTRVMLFGGRATIIDGGLGMLIGDESEEWRTTIPGAADPTVAYLSPEQAAGEGPPTTESDVWALGAVVYFAMFGAPPFDARTRAELAVATARKLVSLETARDRSLGALIRPCLAREPALRPTIDEIASDARAAIEPAVMTTDVSTPGASLSVADFRPESAVWRAPRSLLLGGIFAVFLAVGLLLRPEPDKPAAASGGLPALATDPPAPPRVVEAPSASVSASASASIVVRPPIKLAPVGTVAH